MLTSGFREELGGSSWHTAINRMANASSWDHARVSAPTRVGVEHRGGPVTMLTQPGPTDSPSLKVLSLSRAPG